MIVMSLLKAVRNKICKHEYKASIVMSPREDARTTHDSRLPLDGSSFNDPFGLILKQIMRLIIENYDDLFLTGVDPLHVEKIGGTQSISIIHKTVQSNLVLMRMGLLNITTVVNQNYTASEIQ